jgi:hypothetical protein
MAKRSPLSPGAYGKPQRWHEILTEAADARAAKREDQRRRNTEAADQSALSAAAVIATLFS